MLITLPTDKSLVDFKVSLSLLSFQGPEKLYFDFFNVSGGGFTYGFSGERSREVGDSRTRKGKGTRFVLNSGHSEKTTVGFHSTNSKNNCPDLLHDKNGSTNNT